MKVSVSNFHSTRYSSSYQQQTMSLGSYRLGSDIEKTPQTYNIVKLSHKENNNFLQRAINLILTLNHQSNINPGNICCSSYSKSKTLNVNVAWF